MADIFEEVDEDLKHENYKRLWDRYGRYIVAIIVIVIGGAAANVGWKSYTESRQLELSEQFVAALMEADSGNLEEAAGAMSQLASETDSGYAMLARFREAALRREAGAAAASIDIYDAIAADTSIEPLYRDLGTLLSVMSQVDSGDPAALSNRLQPLAAAGAWRHTANEYLGILAIRQGNSDAARSHFQAVADDATAPSGARSRSAELLRTLAP
ncbi:MAG: tetratricopeptide repeat protein [Alphaproteobacteria bacterium]